MDPEMEMLRCTIVRGGTSKGVFIMMNEYPKERTKRDAVILAVYGSPDVRHIDGLGGADVLTSKHAIVSPSSQPGADVDYTFAQVSFDSAFVDYHANCGNISSAVGPFAIDEGLVEMVRGLDILIVRDLNGDIYFGQPRGARSAPDGEFAGARRGFDTMRYSEPEIVRIAHVAFKAGRERKKKVCSVDKASVLETSQVWRDGIIQVGAAYAKLRTI